MEKTSNVWDVEVRVQYRYRVVYDKEVTRDQAVDLFNITEYEDVIDTEELSAEAVEADW